MTQPSLFPSLVKASCRLYTPCQPLPKAVLGPERYNASGTCMNQTATCVKCGRQMLLSHNLLLPKSGKGKAAA